MNAAYGYLGAIGKYDPETGKREGGCPYPNFGAAETITFLGREGIHHTVAVAVKFFKQFGVEAKIVYGDTDSVLFCGDIRASMRRFLPDSWCRRTCGCAPCPDAK